MKKTLVLSLMVALCFGCASRIFAADDPGDKFLEAYFLIQEGDAAERQGEWAKAEPKFQGALDILNQIKAQSPDWNPHIIEFRIHYVTDHLAEVKAKLAPPTPPPQPATPAPGTTAPPAEVPAPPTPTNAPTAPTTSAPSAPTAPTPAPAAPAATVPVAPAPVPTPAPAVENEQVKQLTAELERAREQVKQLETARDELNTKLQEQLSKVAPTQTNQQIEDLLKTNQDLAAKLAAAQTQIEEARARAAAAPPPPPPAPVVPAGPSPEVAQLRTELAQTRGELQRTKDELQQTRVELGTTRQALEKSQADNAELRRSYDSVIAQLTDANRRLASAKASSDKDDEIIRQLRKENALLRIIADRKASSFSSAEEEEENPNGPSIPELRGWRPHARPRPVTVKQEAPKPPPPPPPAPAPAVEESGRGKLVATLTAPKKVETTPEPVTTQTNAPTKPAAPAKKTAPPTESAKTQTNAPAKAVTPVAKMTPPPTPKKEVAKVTEMPPKSTEQPRPVPPLPPPPPNERELLNEGRAALALKDLDKAATKYTAVLALDPSNLTALSSLGSIRYQQGRVDDAEQYLRKAVAAAPNDANTRALLGAVFIRKGLTEDAFNELTRAVALDPHNAEAHNYLGIVLSQKGWGTAGEQQIQTALDINPQYADAHFNLAVIYAKQRTPNLELARYHYKKALDLGAPPDPELEALLKKLSEKPAAPGTDSDLRP